jgi:translocation protein SEC63
LLCFAVIDDENPTVYTAGAIVTVTVTLVRYSLSVLLGEDTSADVLKPQDTSSFSKGDEEEDDDKKEELANVRITFHISKVKLSL